MSNRSLKIDTDKWRAWFKHRRDSHDLANRDTVTEFLRNGSEYRIEAGNRLLQILILPSFEPIRSYELFSFLGPKQARVEGDYILLQTTWDERAEKQRWLHTGKPEYVLPNLQLAYVEVDSDVVKGLFEPFKANIPIWFEPNKSLDKIGLDGTKYELALGGYFLGVRYVWWESVPDEWGLLAETTDRMIVEFDRLLATKHID